MIALVTGAAGFIGSHLVERLVTDGWTVRAADRNSIAEAVPDSVPRSPVGRFGLSLHTADLLTTDLRPLLDGVDVVFHHAGQPGVRASWANGFAQYSENNVEVTQRLLEATRDAAVKKFVYASSSSVYGNAAAFPSVESDATAPHSPYGVTKLAGELLCGAYARNFDLPVTSLRYFTVYGPRQRRDMALHRIIEAALGSEAFPKFGTGNQVRDFTYVGDIVEANVRVAAADLQPGEVINVSGGSAVSLNELIHFAEETLGRSVPIEEHPDQAGDVSRTGGSIDKARALLGWTPRTSLVDGVAAQVEWHRSLVTAR